MHTNSWGQHSAELDDNRPLGRREQQQAESDLFDYEEAAAAGRDVEMQAVTVPPPAVHAEHVSGGHQVASGNKGGLGVVKEGAVV